MSHLMFDEVLLSDIRTKSKLDAVLNSHVLPPEALYSYKNDLYILL